MNLKHSLFFIILLSSCAFIYAQDDVVVTVPMSKWQSMEDNIKQLNDSITKLQKTVLSKDTTISNLNLNIENVSQKLKSANSSNTELQFVINKMKTDSVANAKALGDLRSQLLASKRQLGRVDTMAIQMIMTYMNLKCSEKRINLLRTEYANISNNEIKTQYRQWDTLLSLYVSTYNDLRTIAKDASEKIPTASMPALRDRYIAETEHRISGLQYVIKFFANKDVTSPYLNTMIQDVRDLIKYNKGIEEYNRFLKLHP